MTLEEILNTFQAVEPAASEECKKFMISLITKVTDQSFYIAYLEGRLNLTDQESQELRDNWKNART